MDYYGILGLDSNVESRDIKVAYMRLCLINHPDKGGDQEKFVEIQEAYENLSNEYLRGIYDILIYSEYKIMVKRIELMKKFHNNKDMINFVVKLVEDNLDDQILNDYSKVDLFGDIKEGNYEKIVYLFVKAWQDDDIYYHRTMETLKLYRDVFEIFIFLKKCIAPIKKTIKIIKYLSIGLAICTSAYVWYRIAY